MPKKTAHVIGMALEASPITITKMLMPKNGPIKMIRFVGRLQSLVQEHPPSPNNGHVLGVA